tara:strand:- start:53 stop:559 length:507 start_codon:yes stop_codon:yes gene_type:complete
MKKIINLLKNNKRLTLVIFLVLNLYAATNTSGVVQFFFTTLYLPAFIYWPFLEYKLYKERKENRKKIEEDLKNEEEIRIKELEQEEEKRIKELEKKAASKKLSLSDYLKEEIIVELLKIPGISKTMASYIADEYKTKETIAELDIEELLSIPKLTSKQASAILKRFEY